MSNNNGLSPNRPCILVVEDDDAVRRSIQLLLRSRGMDVRAYASAKDAVGDPEVRSAECLIADLVMPEVDGIELLRALRGSGWNGSALLISGHLTPALQQKAAQAGYRSAFQKPVTDGALLGFLREAMAHS